MSMNKKAFELTSEDSEGAEFCYTNLMNLGVRFWVSEIHRLVIGACAGERARSINCYWVG